MVARRENAYEKIKAFLHRRWVAASLASLKEAHVGFVGFFAASAGLNVVNIGVAPTDAMAECCCAGY